MVEIFIPAGTSIHDAAGNFYTTQNAMKAYALKVMYNGHWTRLYQFGYNDQTWYVSADDVIEYT